MPVDRALLSKAFAFAIAEAVSQLRSGVPAQEIVPRERMEDELLNPELVECAMRDAVLGPCLKYVELYIHICAHQHTDETFLDCFGVCQADALEACDQIADHCWAGYQRLPAHVEAIRSRL
jgi:hypothetical protein